jgi:acyl-CoA synthetase (AMP-forming)/AMP-acid ligase II
MSRLHDWAQRTPDKVALLDLETGHEMSFKTLDERVQRASQWMIAQGMQAANGVLLLMENRTEIIEIGLAARRSGLYFTPVSTHLALPELAHIARDFGAQLLLVSAQTAPVVQALLKQQGLAGLQVFCVGTDVPAGMSGYEDGIAGVDPHSRLPERPLGRDMLYSSGTTGFPKGVRRALVPAAMRDQPEPEVLNWQRTFGFDADTKYLSPAPLYHAAPLRYVMRTLEVGGTAILMKKFDAERALSAIDQYGATHSQWVPTMFVRMLELPEQTRAHFHLKSMKVAIHAAAPCPIHVKQALLDWWGDIVFEYYGGSEGFGVTSIGPVDWRSHPGSVGRATLGVIHIVDDTGAELPVGEIGKIYFSGGPAFEYWNDPRKTRDAYNAQGWATYGDMGHVDAEGYLYLADRRTDLILSGGVNIYPQEIENAMGQHPLVQDVAVIGVPDADFGQVPKAVVQLHDHALASELLAHELIAFCRDLLSRVKMPKSIVFEENLPRLETGKLLRRVLKEQYQHDPHAGYLVKP